eukprot:gene414-220_t
MFGYLIIPIAIILISVMQKQFSLLNLTVMSVFFSIITCLFVCLFLTNFSNYHFIICCSIVVIIIIYFTVIIIVNIINFRFIFPNSEYAIFILLNSNFDWFFITNSKINRSKKKKASSKSRMSISSLAFVLFYF